MSKIQRGSALSGWGTCALREGRGDRGAAAGRKARRGGLSHNRERRKETPGGREGKAGSRAERARLSGAEGTRPPPESSAAERVGKRSCDRCSGRLGSKRRTSRGNAAACLLFSRAWGYADEKPAPAPEAPGLQSVQSQPGRSSSSCQPPCSPLRLPGQALLRATLRPFSAVIAGQHSPTSSPLQPGLTRSYFRNAAFTPRS